MEKVPDYHLRNISNISSLDNHKNSTTASVCDIVDPVLLNNRLILNHLYLALYVFFLLVSTTLSVFLYFFLQVVPKNTATQSSDVSNELVE